MAQRLILIDGSAMIFRAYYAIPANLTTRTGLHTNAIYGFTNMMRKLLAGKTPDLAAVIFDARGANFRHAKFSDYKAQRTGPEDDLIEQYPWIDKVVEAYRFVRLQIPGFEADDVIGTLTRKATAAGYEVFIVSADKDFCQLIGDGVRMVDGIRDITYDTELVRKKWGVKPEQFVDFLAMVGDKIDNIPGVPGIGPKGASVLLEKYGNLEGILANLAEVPGKNGKLLVEFQDQAKLSYELATIDCAMELPVSLDDLRYTPATAQDLNPLFHELEFFSLLSQEAKGDQARSEEGETHYERLDAEQLGERLAGLQRAAIHPLYNLPSPVTGEWVGLAFSTSPGTAFYSDEFPGQLVDYLEDPERQKIIHEHRALVIMCARRGITLRGVVGDTRLASFLIDPTKLIPHELSNVCKEFLHRTIRPLKELTGSGQKEMRLSDLDPALVGDFACHLADVVGQLWPILHEGMAAAGQEREYLDLELPLAPVLALMELEGILVDPVDLEAMGVEFRARVAEIEQEIYAIAGREFNVGSTKQLGAVLFDELKLPVIKRNKTGYSTDAEVLERLAHKHPIAHLLLDHRKLIKLINTYTDVLARAVNPATERIHAMFQQTSGATGRIISSEPDLQRTPIRTPEGERIRRAFIASPGHRLISADWSQIELRVMAHYCDDPLLVAAFRDNLDVHRLTATQIFHCGLDEVTRQQREIAKTVNFATIYGQGATALAQILDIPRKDAQDYIAEYFRAYANVRTWLDETMAAANRDLYVTTLFGRRRYIPELSSKNFIERQAGERIAANTPIQGSAADLCKLAMLLIAREIEERDLKTRMLLQIHDELVFECPDDEVDAASDVVRRHMEGVYPLKVPLVVNLGVGANWGEAHG